jgi:hypothetical protein
MAPRPGTWPEHLKDVGDRELIQLAGDYCWLLEKNRPAEERGEFQKRREAILAECERRGLEEAARTCRPSQSSSVSRENP